MHLALRQLLKTPGFTAVALLTLALGIGANAGVFSFLHALLTRPLPLPRVEELVFWGEHSEQVPGMSVSWPNFLDWQERQKSLSDFGVFRNQSLNYVGSKETERLDGAQFTHGLWRALAVPPVAGRWFNADEDKPGATPTALVSESFAARALGGTDAALGQTVVLDGEVYTVVGVMPASFLIPRRNIDVWLPFGLVGDHHHGRRPRSGQPHTRSA